MEIFLTKHVNLDKLFSVYYQSYPKRVFISTFFALLGWILGLGEVYLVGFSPSFIDIWIIEAKPQPVQAGSFLSPLA
jgi:hypothetical protein